MFQKNLKEKLNFEKSNVDISGFIHHRMVEIELNLS